MELRMNNGSPRNCRYIKGMARDSLIIESEVKYNNNQSSKVAAALSTSIAYFQGKGMGKD